MDECSRLPLHNAIMYEYNQFMYCIFHTTHIHYLIYSLILVGAVLVTISSYSFRIKVDEGYLAMFAVGLLLMSPLIIVGLVLFILRLCALLACLICWGSKPIATKPVAASGGRTGHPKSNSPLSVLRVV